MAGTCEKQLHFPAGSQIGGFGAEPRMRQWGELHPRLPGPPAQSPTGFSAGNLIAGRSRKQNKV